MQIKKYLSITCHDRCNTYQCDTDITIYIYLLYMRILYGFIIIIIKILIIGNIK